MTELASDSTSEAELGRKRFRFGFCMTSLPVFPETFPWQLWSEAPKMEELQRDIDTIQKNIETIDKRLKLGQEAVAKATSSIIRPIITGCHFYIHLRYPRSDNEPQRTKELEIFLHIWILPHEATFFKKSPQEHWWLDSEKLCAK